MMHPTVIAALAVERHTELLRVAEAHRRIALARPNHSGVVSRASERLGHLASAFRIPVVRSQPELCCA